MGGCCGGSRNNNFEKNGEMMMRFFPKENKNGLLHPEYTSNMSNILYDQYDKIDNEQMLKYKNSKNKLIENIQILNNNSNKNGVFNMHIEFFWNIMKYYKDDFTQCDYIIYDLRENEKKKENFLKKFKSMNYSVDSIENLNSSKINIFKSFLKGKLLIIIPNDCDNFCQISKLISIINKHKINIKYFIVSQILNDEEGFFYFEPIIYNLYKKLDSQYFNNYPNILFSLKEIKYINNNNFIFIDTKKFEIKNSVIEPEIYDFLLDLKIKCVLDLDFHNNINVATYEIYDQIYYITYNYTGINNLNQFKKLFNLIKSIILNQGTFIILFNDKIIEDDILSKWISILIFHLFYFPLNNKEISQVEIILENIKSLNPLFLNQKCLKDLIPKNLEKQFENIFSLNNNYFSFNLNTSKIEEELKNLLSETKEVIIFLDIISVLERVLLNILNHQGVEKFYKIKKKSNTLNNKIIKYKATKNLFYFFGFSENKNEPDFYILDINTDIKYFQENYDYLVLQVKKIISKKKIIISIL